MKRLESNIRETQGDQRCVFFFSWLGLVIVPKFWDRISKQNKHVEFERLGTAESIGK